MDTADFFADRLSQIPIVIDEGIDGVYLISMPRPLFVGSTQAFGAFYAVNLARAYKPDDVP